ncbi:MAG: hypothetical protein WC782_02810 [Methylococcaceae bacterium]|jgi:hypothetical protein
MSQDHKAYKEKVDAQLKEWEAKAELLKAKSINLAADAKLELEKQIQHIDSHKSELAAYCEQVNERAGDAWEDVKDEAEDKWKKFSESVQSFVSKHT